MFITLPHAAQNLHPWMANRSPQGWRTDTIQGKGGHCYCKRNDAKGIALMEYRGQHESTARLRLPGSDEFPSNYEMEYFADVHDGRIEVINLDFPEMYMMTYGNGTELFCRVGHLTLPSGSGHWVLLHSYLDNGSDIACAARRRQAMFSCSSPGCCLGVERHCTSSSQIRNTYVVFAMRPN